MNRLSRSFNRAATQLKPWWARIAGHRRVLWRAVRAAFIDDTPACVKENRKWKGSAKGKRCFVVGNGSSLGALDLTLLAREDVITVNDFLMHAARWNIEPVFHCLLDPEYFQKGNPNAVQMLEAVKNAPAQTRFFANHCFKEEIATLYPHSDRFNYFHFEGEIGTNQNIEIDSALPHFQTVTVAALALARYLGYAQIYLIGCDLDFLKDVVSVSPLTIRGRHFYEEETVNRILPGWSYRDYCQAICKMLEGFEFIAKAPAQDQKILNASVGGMLDMFDRVSFAGLFPVSRKTSPPKERALAGSLG